MTWVSIILWSVASYFIVKRIAENGLNVKPMNYALITFLGGFMLSMCFLGTKYCKQNKNTVGEVICWILFILSILIQIAIIF